MYSNILPTTSLYVHEYTNELDCPSADTLKLIIKRSTHNVVTETACDSYMDNQTLQWRSIERITFAKQ